ncbi:MAG TPA: hypothetical protein VLX92_25355 [Kofleriaceae bacterium]|nr:hypothetical protein [Kofleriaceae bacterium]
MRRLPVAMLAIASGALAAPAAAPSTWADWVGDWDGKLKWTSCTIAGSPDARVALDATDGAVAADFGQDAFGVLSLVEDRAGWIGQRGDLTAHLARPRADTLDVAIELDSGCQIRGTLHRASIGIAACDRLAGWARIESRCSKLARPPLEDAARLARQKATWAKAHGDDRARIGAQCDARASRIEAELIDAGCAPNPDPSIGLRGAECQAMRASAARLSRCPATDPDLGAVLSREATSLVAAAQTASDAALPVVEAECHDLREKITRVAQRDGCPP